MARVDARDLLVSRYGIREGLLLETARITPTIADPGEGRDRSIREFAERCRYEPLHSQTVQRLALGLFDALGARLGALPEDRHWGAHRKSGLLAEIAGVPIEIVMPDGTVLSSTNLEGPEDE
jgi:exopolyphosphatase/pppGpp-phosphohydrolase